MKEKIEREVYETIKEKGIYADDVSYDDSRIVYPFNVVMITVDGDWKHDHIALDQIMKESNYTLIEKINVEDNCSDWYEATHVYLVI